MIVDHAKADENQEDDGSKKVIERKDLKGCFSHTAFRVPRLYGNFSGA